MSTEARPLLVVLGWATAIAAMLLLVALEPEVLLLVLAGILFAVFLKHPSAWIARRLHIPYGVALAFFVLVLVGSFATGFVLIGAQFVTQIQSLVSQLPEAIESFLRWIRQDRWAREIFGGAGQPANRPVTIDTKTLLASAAGVGGAVSGLLAGAAAIFFIGVYGAAQPDAYLGGVLYILPARYRARVRAAVEAVDVALARWLLGRIAAMTIVGVISTVGLTLLHSPLALALGVIAGGLTFIEYVGAIVSAVPAVLLAAGRGTLDMLWIVLLYTGAHVVEGYLITPVITKRMVHFAPAFTLAVQLLFVALFGVAGITLATPSFVIASVLLKKLYFEGRDA